MNYQRVAADDVQAIYATEQDLQPFIDTATLIVTERLVGHYSDARLREIENWLTAHLAARVAAGGPVGAGRAGQSGAGGRNQYQLCDAPLGEGLANSRYGQHLKMLDYKGILTQDSTSKVAHFSVH